MEITIRHIVLMGCQWRWRWHLEIKKSNETIIVIQENGKKRGIYKITKELNKDELIKEVSKSDKFSKIFSGEVKKMIYIPGKILNIVKWKKTYFV